VNARVSGTLCWRRRSLQHTEGCNLHRGQDRFAQFAIYDTRDDLPTVVDDDFVAAAYARDDRERAALHAARLHGSHSKHTYAAPRWQMMTTLPHVAQRVPYLYVPVWIGQAGSPVI
jgi:hypothetical protein